MHTANCRKKIWNRWLPAYIGSLAEKILQAFEVSTDFAAAEVVGRLRYKKLVGLLKEK